MSNYEERLKYKIGNVLEDYEIYTAVKSSPESTDDFKLVAESGQLKYIVDDLIDAFGDWVQDKINEELS